jgi:polysaccharide biosynthesis/export protein
MRIKLLQVLCVCIFVSCTPRNLAYFSDLEEQALYTEAVENSSEPKIQPDDLLSISVSSLSLESNALFNRGIILPTGSAPNIVNQNENLSQEGYLVNKNGFVNFPVLGEIKLSGLTSEEATSRMVAELSKHVKEPIVNIRFLNFKVTVVGEVSRPSTFTIPTEKINIIEAIGLAGDMTAFGKRENVLIIRENGGIRTMARLNLNSKEILNSPYFYLQQNDVVYVEPDKGKAIQNNPNNRWIPVAAAAVSASAIVISKFIFR